MSTSHLVKGTQGLEHLRFGQHPVDMTENKTASRPGPHGVSAVSPRLCGFCPGTPAGASTPKACSEGVACPRCPGLSEHGRVSVALGQKGLPSWVGTARCPELLGEELKTRAAIRVTAVGSTAVTSVGRSESARRDVTAAVTLWLGKKLLS